MGDIPGITPDDAARLAGVIPVKVPGMAATAPPNNLPPTTKGNIEKAHQIVKLLVEKGLLEQYTLKQTFELIEEIQKLI